MNALIEWLKTRTIKAHSLAATAGIISTLLVSDEAFRDAVMKFFHAHPKIGTELIAIATIVTAYQKASKESAPVIPAQPKETQ